MPPISSFPITRFVLSHVDEMMRSRVRVVQVGANDGRLADNLNGFLTTRGWSGLLIEPVPQYFAMLKAAYRDHPRVKPMQMAIDRQSGSRPIFYADEAKTPADKPWWQGLASMDKSHLTKHGLPEDIIRSVSVQTAPLSGILETTGFDDAHLLFVDVEGWEEQVLDTVDFATSKPLVVSYESKHLPADARNRIDNRLETAGYDVFKFMPDTLALSRDMAGPHLFRLLADLEAHR